MVVLVHGSGGVSGFVDDWAVRLNALGVATFVFDSFTPRGIVDTREDQSQLARLAMIEDAYRALALLSRHPRVDPGRIALMGFSRGGQSTLWKAGKDVRLTEYPGAHHVFDWAALKTPVKLPKAQTVRHCRIEEASEGRLVNGETKQPFTYDDPCVERGVTIAYDPEAAAEAATAVTDLVNTVLKAK